MSEQHKVKEDEELFDITIVGGGPAGLFGAFYSGLREMKTKIIEFQPRLGGKVHVYPEKMIWDVGGVTPLPGAQLIDQMVAQGLTFDPTVVFGEKVVAIKRREDGTFVLETLSGQNHYSKSVLLAVGGGILKPIKLEIEGAERFELTNLHYTVKSLDRFKDKTLLISGGGHSAVDWANELAPIAAKVYLTYRKDALKGGHEADISRLQKNNVHLLLNMTIDKLIASDDHSRVQTVVLRNNEDQETLELSMDELIINHGYERDKELLANSGVELHERFVKGSVMSESSVPGLYAAGDVLHHDGKLHLIAGAFQDAVHAVNKAKQFVAPEAEEWAMVSSHNDRFAERNRELLKHLYKS